MAAAGDWNFRSAQTYNTYLARYILVVDNLISYLKNQNLTQYTMH